MATAAKSEKVIFVEDTSTVHFLDGDVVEYPDGAKREPITAKVCVPGEIIELADVPSYLRELVEEGKAPGLTLLSPAAAKRLVKQAEMAKAKISDLAAIAESDDEE